MFEKNEIISKKYAIRREAVFLILSGLFIGTLAMLNILGITRLIDLSFNLFGIAVPFRVFIGVLPYPITFLCTARKELLMLYGQVQEYSNNKP